MAIKEKQATTHDLNRECKVQRGSIESLYIPLGFNPNLFPCFFVRLFQGWDGYRGLPWSRLCLTNVSVFAALSMVNCENKKLLLKGNSTHCNYTSVHCRYFQQIQNVLWCNFENESRVCESSLGKERKYVPQILQTKLCFLLSFVIHTFNFIVNGQEKSAI